MLALTSDQRRSIAQQAKKALLNRSYEDYFLEVHRGRYQVYRHHKIIIDYLQRIADGESLSIIFEMPPRHGKSVSITETFPSYYVAKNPHKRVIATAYSDYLARKFGRLNRDKLSEFGHYFDVSLDPNNFSATNWSLDGSGGGMIATGIGGSITGEGADLLLIDDPVKNAEAANSPTQRQKTWDEWESTLSTRLHDGASVIVVMTRWNEDDLVGRLLANGSRDWIRVRLPAIAEEDDLLGREIGEALWPEKYDEAWAAAKAIEVGTRSWNALYQQRPSPAQGAIFKREWIRYYKALPQLEEELTSWDAAFKGGDGSDNVSGQVWGRRGAEFYLVDRRHGKMDFTATVAAVEMLYARYRTYTTLIEDKANGPAIINTLQTRIPGIIPVQPLGDKVTRASAIAPFWEAGNVYLPDPSIAPWVDEFVEELVSFPHAAHDDDVDAMSQALNRYAMVAQPNIREL